MCVYNKELIQPQIKALKVGYFNNMLHVYTGKENALLLVSSDEEHLSVRY